MFSATEKIIWVDNAQSEVRVGDRHLLAAGIVTDRTRTGASTAWSNQKSIGFRFDECDGAAAGADRRDVDDRLQHAQTFDDGFLGVTPITLSDESYVAARSCHVRGDDVRMFAMASDVGRSDHPTSRTRLQIGDGAHMLAMGDAAVSLHDQKRSVEAAALELGFQSFRVALHRW